MMMERSSIIAAIVAVVVATASATSCSGAKSKPSAGDDETFAGAVGRLVEDKCETCHHQGGIAPFALSTYDQVRDMGAAARDAMTRRQMPPWGMFDEPDCTVKHEFKGDLSLTQDQIDLFSRWVDRGMPAGDLSKLPPSNVESAPAGLTDKSASIEVGHDFVVKGKGDDSLVCFPVDPKFTEDTWISESIVVPTDPKVVHHALVYLDPGQEGMARAAGADSYPCFGGADISSNALLLSWSPGGTPTAYGENAGLRVPKNSHLVVQVHYHPIATTTTGALNIEVKKLPKAPARSAMFALVGNAENGDKNALLRLLPGPDDPPQGPEFFIPSNAKDHTETMELSMPPAVAPARISAVGAHMHWAGVAMKVEVNHGKPADSEPSHECLLNTTYNFSWQRTYSYASPYQELPVLRGGDKLRITCTYDNTKDNPNIVRVMKELRRSTPPDIRLGAESFDEMCQAILVFLN